VPPVNAEAALWRDGSLSGNRLIVAMLSAVMLAGCAASRRYEAPRPEKVNVTEAMLSEAGFRTIKVDSSEHVGLVSDLAPHEIRSYDAPSGTVYWYYDPGICSCVYEGRQDEFDDYQMLMRQQNDTAQYVADSDDTEISSLYMLNPTYFPPPIFWGGGHGGDHGGCHGGMHGRGHGGGGHG
jgi:hypothetical protein